MKSKTFKKEDWEKVIIKSRDIKSRKDPFIEAIPWITTQQYRDWIEVRKIVIPDAVTISRVVTTINVAVSVSTWSYDLTSSDIGFTPSFVNIKWFLDWWDRSWCDISMDWTRQAWLYSVWESPRFADNRAINLFDTASNRFQANFTSFIDWWVRISITQNSHDNIVKLAVTAYA